MKFVLNLINFYTENGNDVIEIRIYFKYKVNIYGRVIYLIKKNKQHDNNFTEPEINIYVDIWFEHLMLNALYF